MRSTKVLSPYTSRKPRLRGHNNDLDNDGVPNWRDCRPYDPNEQGWLHRRYEGTKKRVGEYFEDREEWRQELRKARRKSYKERAKAQAKLEWADRIQREKRVLKIRAEEYKKPSLTLHTGIYKPPVFKFR